MPIATLRPNAPYDFSSFPLPVQYPDSGEHWDKVDEVVADDDTTYVATTPGASQSAEDYYELSDLPAGVGTISNVKIVAVCRETADEFGEALVGVIIDWSDKYWSGVFPLSDTYQSVSNDWAVNPSTGLAWTIDEINALRVGIALYSNGGGSVHSRCTQVYIEVTYSGLVFAQTAIIG